MRPAPSGGGGYAAKPVGSGRSAPRPPPPPQSSAFCASAHVTGPPARHRPRRRSTASGHVTAWHRVAPLGGVDTAQQAQQGHQLCNLPATVRAIGEMAVERGTLRLHETADQVGAQREADVVILSAHHVTAPRKTSDRTTCPLTIPGVVRFTVTPFMWPRPSPRITISPASQSALSPRESPNPVRLLGGSSGDLGRITTISIRRNCAYDRESDIQQTDRTTSAGQ